MKKRILLTMLFLFAAVPIFASEVDIPIPDLSKSIFPFLWGIDGKTLLIGLTGIIFVTLGISHHFFVKLKKLPAHASMLAVSAIIYETCITYLKQQGRFILKLFPLISILIISFLLIINTSEMEISKIQLIVWVLIVTLSGVLGTYFVAWFGIRVNNYANSRNAFVALRGKPFNVVMIPLTAGMSIGLCMIAIELIAMMIILLFVPRDAVGICFIGFAIGESLGASALRIAGGIFTKIADIGADLMKIVFQMDEDDPRNPGVIADCVGDNAGDSVGPTADGFETFGVTGIANIIFISVSMAVFVFVPEPEIAGRIITTLFALRCVMDVFCAVAFFVNRMISKHRFEKLDDFDFEKPLSSLIRISAAISITLCFGICYLLLGDIPGNIWLGIASSISFGILGALFLPEATKEFTSSNSAHVKNIIQSSKIGGSSLNILSGLAVGFISAFWNTLVVMAIMAIATKVSSLLGMGSIIPHADVFCNGLIAFGFLSMGAVTVAVDSYGPVSDNAQSVYKLSKIRHLKGIVAEIERLFGFTPDFDKAEYLLDKNDAAGNTFKSTTKPVLIATAIVGVTMIIHSIVMLLNEAGMLNLSILNPKVLEGLMAGGAVIYLISGGAIQAVTTGAHKAVMFIKKNIAEEGKSANIDDCNAVVKTCTKYGQGGAWNIIMFTGSTALFSAFYDPSFCISYLISLAVFGLLQAMNTANAGGAWDNTKKAIEARKEFAHTTLHDAVVTGDTVGDPYKDTLAVILNPVIKFSTMICVFALEIAKELAVKNQIGVYEYIYIHTILAIIFGLTSLYFALKLTNLRIQSSKKDSDPERVTEPEAEMVA